MNVSFIGPHLFLIILVNNKFKNGEYRDGIKSIEDKIEGWCVMHISE